MIENGLVARSGQTQSREAGLLAQCLADGADLPRSVLHGMRVDDPVAGEMQHQVLAVGVHPRQA